MLGIADYDSDECADVAAPPPAVVTPTAAASAALNAKPKAEAAAGAPAVAGGKRRGANAGPSASKLADISRELAAAKSATAVVQVVRCNLAENWDLKWGVESMQLIARKSTGRTRREWAEDAAVKDLADKLTAHTKGAGASDVARLLEIMEGLRRMGFETAEDQSSRLEQATLQLVADNWEHSVGSLARLFWLSAPLAAKAAEVVADKDDAETKAEARATACRLRDFSSLLPTQLRRHAGELMGPQIVLVVSGLRTNAAARDEALVSRIVARLKAAGVHEGVSCTDLVDVAEGLKELKVTDQLALRPLGQEILRRRGELNPAETHRVHAAFDSMKFPLQQVWSNLGSGTKRDAALVVTTQVFAPQEGHDKHRRGNNDIQRVSPPRVVRDRKMMSY